MSYWLINKIFDVMIWAREDNVGRTKCNNNY